MDADEFRKHGKDMVDIIADYLEDIRERRPVSDVEPGYIQTLLPEKAPQDSEDWEDVIKDVERVVMPGVTHWNHPNFFAFQDANSYPAICADILSNGFGCVGLSWIASPAYTELEVVMMDWLAKMLKLPDCFMSGGKGGGVMQGSATEATLVALLSARRHTISKVKKEHPELSDTDIQGKLVAYASDQAHCSVERTCKLGAVRCCLLQSDDKGSLNGETVAKAIAEDKAKGCIPFYLVATLGTPSSCAFDKLTEIAPVCKQNDVWLHVDAAYAGSTFICPEFRPLLDGVEDADSFNFDLHKMLMVNYECSAMWVRNSDLVVDAFHVDPLYLRHEKQLKVPEYQHWRIPLGVRFTSLKVWFVLRMFGVKKLQEHIRKHIRLAKEFENLVRCDKRFEVVNDVPLGVVFFRLKGNDNHTTEALLKMINDDGRIVLVQSKSKGMTYIRFITCATRTESEDINFAWNVVQEITANYHSKPKL